MIQSLRFEYKGISYACHPQEPLDISLPINQGDDNVNCYFAETVKYETIRQGDFVGSVAEGGPCNYQKVTITPHGNGTHTECYGHVSSDPRATLFNCLNKYLFFAQLISLQAQKIDNQSVITFQDFLKKVNTSRLPEALIIRTLPNDSTKKRKKYSGTNPTFLDPEIGHFLASNHVEHLLVDLPSVDPEVDGGLMKTHKNFWQFPHQIRWNATISELVYIDNHIEDDFYLLNLQVTSLQTDASPSKPILYALISE